jgi:acetyl-CoA synthetase
MTDLAWEPTGYYAEGSNLARFVDEYGYDAYEELIPDTEGELAELWGAFAEDTGIVWREPYDEVLDTADGPAFAHWFPGGRLNAVETALDQWVERTPDAAMYAWEDEDGNASAVSYAAMRERVDRLANAFSDHGVERGDVVGITFPLHPNAFAAALAAWRIGAAFTMVFPGYGVDAMGHRFDDSGAELVVTADGYTRGGSVNDLRSKVDAALSDAPAVEDVLVYEHLGLEGECEAATEHDWGAFVEGFDAAVETAVMDSDDVAFIAYSSGTTGKPKGTIHTHASTLAMGNKECRYHFDLSPGDALLWITDFGWIIAAVWMLAGAPALGATTVLLEGAPGHPDGDRVWRAIEDHGVTTFGISPSGSRGLRQHNEDPRADHDLSTLRVLGSTGEPWDEAGWRWHQGVVGDGEVPLMNISGGTELAGGILSPTPLTPLKPGTLWGPGPGVAANVYDENGEAADEGYLVVELPIPGMTHSLTSGDERYIEEYWSTFEGVWNQNDWVEIDADGFWYVTGRADDTMNVAGRRVTAPEIEAAVGGTPGVSESTVVPVPDDVKGQVPVAFVTLLEGVDREGIEEAVREHVTEELGAPFRPARVHVVSTLPRTQTGKIPRGVIESVYLGNPPGNVSTLDRPEVLKGFPRHEG